MMKVEEIRCPVRKIRVGKIVTFGNENKKLQIEIPFGAKNEFNSSKILFFSGKGEKQIDRLKVEAPYGILSITVWFGKEMFTFPAFQDFKRNVGENIEEGFVEEEDFLTAITKPD